MKVVQHCFGRPGEGGPATALARLQLASSPPYPVIWQDRPANGISVGLLRRFVTELQALKPDILHVRGLGNEGFHGALAGSLARVPKILVSIHGSQRDLVGGGGARRAIVTRVLEPATLRMADSIVAVASSTAKRDFLAPFARKMLAPVPNGVPIPESDIAARESMRKRLGIESGRCVGLCVSRLTVQKGYSDLAEALARYDRMEGAPSWDLVIVGTGNEENEIRSMFAGLLRTRVNFVGHQPDVAPFYRAADLFLFPSWHENMPNALVEAMSFRLPAIATAVGDVDEILEEGGGIVVPPRSSEALVKPILDLVKSKERRNLMGEDAQRTVKMRYSLAAMEANWRKRYEEIISNGKK